MKRRLFLAGLVAGTLVLAGCNSKMIKPEEKQVKAVYEFDMPDYGATKQDVAVKTQHWLEQDENLTYLYTKNGTVYGMGVVEVETHGDTLKTKFDMQFKIISGNKVEMLAQNFEDQESPRKGYSDRAYVFKYKVKNAVLDLGKAYQDYMDSDTKVETILDQQ